ncbi:MAG: phosphatase PAP2 family protein [Deltaproteobacteria bacterium]|nr:phosphatase PAP2 family protein [Deltaproteobacteria bacterium]
MKKDLVLNFIVPVCIAVLLSVFIGAINADLGMEGLFYSPGKGWFMGQEMPWYFLYHYGNIPAIVMGVCGGLVFVLSFFRKEFVPHKKAGLFLLVFLLLGPGLVVNNVFKDNWGRPRPADIVNFGGDKDFHQIWERGDAGHGKSFPSGHAAVGFFLFAPFFLLRKSNKPTALFFLVLGIFWGSFMGTGRMIQGGHFLSDVLWAGVITYLMGQFLYYVFRFDKINYYSGN